MIVIFFTYGCFRLLENSLSVSMFECMHVAYSKAISSLCVERSYILRKSLRAYPNHECLSVLRFYSVQTHIMQAAIPFDMNAKREAFQWNEEQAWQPQHHHQQHQQEKKKIEEKKRNVDKCIVDFISRRFN